MSTEQTYTEAELTAGIALAVEAATGPLKTELETLKSSLAKDEVEAQIAALKEAHEAELATVRADLDAAKVEASAAETAKAEAETALTAKLAEIETAEAEAVAKAEADARKDERAEAVKEFGLADEYVTANLDRWASMSDDDFTGLTEGWRAIASAVKPEGELTELPRSTAMSGIRTVTTKGKATAMDEVLELKRAGVDPKTSL